MAKKWIKVAAVATTMAMAASSLAALTACGGKKGGDYTYRLATTQLPTSWNAHTYKENQATLVTGYTEDGFYTFDYNDTKDGYKLVPAMAAEMPKDVTDTYRGDKKWNIGVDDEGKPETWRAVRIELRKDLKFDNGKEIKADDFVESVKLLLNPEAANYRADSTYSGNFLLTGAKSYAYSNRTAYIDSFDLYEHYTTDLADKLTFSFFWDNKDNALTAATSMCQNAGYTTLRQGIRALRIVGMFFDDVTKETIDQTEAIINDLNGKTVAQIKADSKLSGYWDTLLQKWPSKPENVDEMLQLLLGKKTFENYDWADVGIKAVNDYTLDFIMEKSLSGFYLNYALTSAMYLVDTQAYTACSSTSQGVYTNDYGTSKDKYVGFGPYRISSFVSGSKLVLEKNPYWYGYNDEANKDLYQTTHISIQQISTPETHLQEFLAGNLDSYGLRADDMATYQSSDYTYYTDGDSTWFVALNPNYSALKNLEASAEPSVAGRKVNKTVLTIKEFRQALSFSLDRSAWAATLDPLGNTAKALYSDLIVSDPDNGTTYRTTDEAKDVIVKFWGLEDQIGEGKPYATVDDAIASITGYDISGAKKLFTEAYNKAVEQHYINPNDDWEVQIVVGMSGDNAESDYNVKGFNLFEKMWTDAVKDTPFEGRLIFKKSAALGNSYGDALRNNNCDLLFGVGWTGSALDPYGLIEAYVSPNYQYDKSWDTKNTMLDISLNIDGTEKVLRASVYDWGVNALNGNPVAAKVIENGEVTESTVTVKAGVDADMSLRLKILSAVEGAVLQQYDMLPLTTDATASLKGMRIVFATEEYVFGMGRGGVKYMTYTMNDKEWASFVKKQGGTLNYA